MKPVSSCLNCPNRHVGCHSACANYTNYIAKRKSADMVKKEMQRLERDISGALCGRTLRRMRTGY